MDLTPLKCLFSRKARKLYQQKRKALVLVMTLVVHNEEEIIEQQIRFHAAMGVDAFIVSTHNCTDATHEILIRLQQDGIPITIIPRTSADHKHHVWVNEMVKLARKKYNATWVINSDADEFYYSAHLDLKKSIRESGNANLLWVDSLFLFPEDRQDYLRSTFFVTRPFQKFEACRLKIDTDPLFEDYIGSQGCTKVIHKTKGFISCTDGNHDAEMVKSVKVHSADIRLYHYHIRSFKGWEAKVQRWEKTIFLLPEGSGEHMKAMVRLYQQGKLREAFDNRYGDSIRTFLVQEGVVTCDPSVKNFLEEKGIL